MDVPAKIVEVWFRAYGFFLMAVTMVTVTLVIVLLLLAFLGYPLFLHSAAGR